MPVAHLVVPIVRSVRLGARGPPTHSEPCLHACDMCLAVGGGPSRPPTTPASPVPPPPAKPARRRPLVGAATSTNDIVPRAQLTSRSGQLLSTLRRARLSHRTRALTAV